MPAVTTRTVQTTPSLASPAAPATAPRRLAALRAGVPLRTLLLGLGGMALLTVGGVGAGGTLVHDPLLADSPLTWVRFGHGKDLATAVLYGGLTLVVWGWVRLGRDVRAGTVGTRGMLLAIGVWTLPLLLAPPLFSRDIYSYLAQGNLALHGLDPYRVGPSALPGPLSENVSPIWQTTPAPYGPLFVLIAKGVVAVTGDNLITGVVLLRLAMAIGLGLLCWSLPGLARHLGGSAPSALWLAAANPLLLVHLVGGAHNDLLMVGLLAAGVLLVLDRRHLVGIVLVTVAVAIKATAGVALPFLVWVWAARLPGSAPARFARATAAGLAVVVGVFALCTLVSGLNLGWLPALKTSSAIVNWLSLPTAVGQLLHTLVNLLVHVSDRWFLRITRTLGSLLLAVVLVRQWWAARQGGPEAVRRAAIALLAVGLLSPATLPWYFSWPLVIGAALPWTGSALVLGTLGSVWMLLVTFPTGDTALYSWGYLAVTLAASVLAAASLISPDPLRLSRRTPAERDRPRVIELAP